MEFKTRLPPSSNPLGFLRVGEEGGRATGARENAMEGSPTSCDFTFEQLEVLGDTHGPKPKLGMYRQRL